LPNSIKVYSGVEQNYDQGPKKRIAAIDSNTTYCRNEFAGSNSAEAVGFFGL